MTNDWVAARSGEMSFWFLFGTPPYQRAFMVNSIYQVSVLTRDQSVRSDSGYSSRNEPKELRERLWKAFDFARRMAPSRERAHLPGWAPGLLVQSMCWAGIPVFDTRHRTKSGQMDIFEELRSAIADVFESDEFARSVMSSVHDPYGPIP